ncbi:MAG: aminotransferase [Clostridiales bacterium]|jgi:DNA-binding transcriptional MocR family regulator|nr:aminotransferase [Clostridiales bacterium]
MSVVAYNKLSVAKITELYHDLHKKYDAFQKMGLRLDMSRGKPSKQQLDLSSGLLDCLSHDDYTSCTGVDCRNYGGLDGIMEMKRIFADILDIDVTEVLVGGNSSLSMMFDNIASNMTHGVRDGIPWQRQGSIRFICPVPGYDRHFAMCDYFHIEMIPIPMKADGPDMDMVETLVSGDPLIKGMFCVPIFSNPDGCVYSDATVMRIAGLQPKAFDFRLYWDNAYCVHAFNGEVPKIPNILRECEKVNNPHMPLIFTSFSKVSFSGAAVSAIASSASNCQYILKRMNIQTVGPDKLNQLRHVRFFGDVQGVRGHMRKMAENIKPKFDAVDEILTRYLQGKEIAWWSKPNGGYFISFNSLNGCAKRIVQLCKEAGVTMTPAGATFPYGRDPFDSNIRIAPTYPTLDELKLAMEIFCAAVEIASLEKLME